MKIFKLLAIGATVPVAILCVVYVWLGRTPATAIVFHGGAMFLPISPTDPRLSPSIRRVLADKAGTPQAGPFAWRDTAPGFAVGDLPVLVDGEEVDRFLLTKVDPSRFKIVARNDPSATTTITAWMRALDARLVINGSYYAPSGKPDTPFVSHGQPLGPSVYDARQGALVVKKGAAAIHDLAQADWQTVLAGADDALVSYPLLVDESGQSRFVKPSSWLANRTFVGMDANGWIVFGTTKDAYFSLARLADFLAHAPIKLHSVLNLDGGPVSCQAVASGTFRRNYCGDYEIQADKEGVKKLSWLFGTWALPVVIAVVDKASPSTEPSH